MPAQIVFDFPDDRSVIFLLHGSLGDELPQSFARSNDPFAWGVRPEHVDSLLHGPSHPCYWDSWAEVVRKAELRDNGRSWRLHFDGDLFAVRI